MSAPIEFRFKRYVRVPKHRREQAQVIHETEFESDIDLRNNTDISEVAQDVAVREPADSGSAESGMSEVRPRKEPPKRSKQNKKRLEQTPKIRKPNKYDYVVNLDEDDEMYWRSSWQDRGSEQLKVGGILSYSTASIAQPSLNIGACPFHPSCTCNERK